jgi:hypothetical protein
MASPWRPPQWGTRRKRFDGLSPVEHQRVAARLGAARGLAMQLTLDLQYCWGKTSPVIKGCMRLATAIDRIRSDLDTRFFEDIASRAAADMPSPYYPAGRLLPDTICVAIKGHFWDRHPRPRTRLSVVQGDMLLERLAVLRHLLDVVTTEVLRGYGASDPLSECCQRLWQLGGLLSRISLAIEREWLARDKAYWPADAANAFLRRLDTLPQTVLPPPVWQAWFDTRDAPDVLMTTATATVSTKGDRSVH